MSSPALHISAEAIPVDLKILFPMPERPAEKHASGHEELGWGECWSVALALPGILLRCLWKPRVCGWQVGVERAHSFLSSAFLGHTLLPVVPVPEISKQSKDSLANCYELCVGDGDP